MSGFLSSLSDTQRACAVLYCHAWPLWLYHISPHYLTTGTIFGKKKTIIYKTYVLIFSTIRPIWNFIKVTQKLV